MTRPPTLLSPETLPPVTRDRLDRFAALLLRWNARLNLIAPRDAPMLWQRHIADSLQLLPLLPADADRGIDLGSGGGFPGLVLAIAGPIPFDLIESDQRKAAFLRGAILETGARATVHASRIEAAELPPARLITARALAPLPRLLPLAYRLLAPGGTCLFLKGVRAAAEIDDAATAWTMSAATTPSRTNPDGVILRITDLQPKTA
ncbi:16S rRNA (guanine(527)-N(7))-methyltransferase RsmG [Rhodopila sp.]|uniref:16S rRNA (guanine(527)-N(7))-methyltransferase RsmG n=1 Tax=Rhodopila sp. TaxID=2480087 RepID=UPI002CC85DE9|nr:16S rRNA (guanine(527)-N(7))-methyltransferase RsmG [Rhodopila sp.]HVZ09968.1 16S rRNA (guanine(527)-N(7))-methyltransferase RsmG [Rhodopila sp.]